jgi:hypothetical protein
METNVKNNNGQAKGVNTVTADKKPQFVAGNPVNVVSKAAPTKDEPQKDAEKPQEQATQLPEQPKTEAPKAQIKAEPAKEEPKKIVLNLEGTLKFIEEMHRKAKQRTKLQDTIKNLDDFEVELRDEADTTDTNYYNGCTLTIEDDNRRKFETKNPTIIWTVAQLVNNMCVEKLAEIEAGIVIPQ